ncbi:hypothetical protein FA15DRAFT_664637 [Coprinopsis marcescibilis]|uniref:DUF5745 domain-containing protein n=1 Tax=Coprinopsis marcescibilis TaxID=230819 RepID=A0A5C3L8A3_COPMA|nr:hypothetical protein FA15DRAFT_664637 [Coprinopsis marcescibilis]
MHKPTRRTTSTPSQRLYSPPQPAQTASVRISGQSQAAASSQSRSNTRRTRTDANNMDEAQDEDEGTDNTDADDRQLVADLNGLLHALHIPIDLISPADLTPSLLIAVLESLLGLKIPIPPIASSSTASASSNSRRQLSSSTSHLEQMKLQKVKMFLGVLETDVLQQDVGLSGLDPRRLAHGELEEVGYVAEVLVWIGKRVGLLDKNNSIKGKQKRIEMETATATASKVPEPAPQSTKSRASSPFTKTEPQPPPTHHPHPRTRSRANTSAENTSANTSTGKNTFASTSTDKNTSLPKPSRFSSPELDATSVFYVPSGSSSIQATSTLLSSVFLAREGESVTTTEDGDPYIGSTAGYGQRKEGGEHEEQEGDYDGRATTTTAVTTPSSVDLSFLPPFESPRAYGLDTPDLVGHMGLPRCIHQLPAVDAGTSLLFENDPGGGGTGEGAGEDGYGHAYGRVRQQQQHQQQQQPRHTDRQEHGHTASDPRLHREQDYEDHWEQDEGEEEEDLDAEYPQPVPVRYDGYIQPVDEDTEISFYEERHSHSLSLSQSRSHTGSHGLSRSRIHSHSHSRSRSHSGSYGAPSNQDSFVGNGQYGTASGSFESQPAPLRHSSADYRRGNGHGHARGASTGSIDSSTSILANLENADINSPESARFEVSFAS